MKRLAIIAIVLAALFGLSACKEYTEVYPLHAVQLTNEESSHGNFFLIAGGYGKNENAQYYFYVESPDGTLSLHKNKFDDIVLKLIPEGTKPYIECTGEYVDKGERYDYDGAYTKAYCVFHVPEESIKHTYDLDIKSVK